MGTTNPHPVRVVRTGLAGHVESEERPEGRETASQVTLSAKSLRTDGSARAKVLRQGHDGVERESQVVRTGGQNRRRDQCADQRNSGAGSHGAAAHREASGVAPPRGLWQTRCGKDCGDNGRSKEAGGNGWWSKAEGAVAGTGWLSRR